MSWHPTLTELRTVLATLYPTVDDARRVVVDAGLDPLRISFDAKAITNWQHILEEALRSSRVDALLQVVRTEYGSNPSLLQAIQAYQSLQTTPPLESTKTPTNSIAPPAISLPKPADKPKPSAQTPHGPVPEPSKTLAVLEHVLVGHKLWVESVAVSPDGKWAVSGAHGKKIRFWDLATGKCLATLAGHYDTVQCVVVTRDGQRILSSSYDDTIRVWNVSDLLEKNLRQIEPENKLSGMWSSPATVNSSISWEAGHMLSLAVLTDGQHVLASGAARDINLWNIDTQECVAILKGHKKVVNSIALTRDETKLVSGSMDKTLRLWDFKTKECLVSLHGHSGHVNSVQITPDGRYAISGSDDRTAKIWDLTSVTCVGTLVGHQNKLDSVAISPDGTLIASTGFQDWTVRLWDWQVRVCIEIIEFKLPIAPTCVAFSPDGLRLIVGTTGGQIYVYRLTEV